MIKNNIYDLLVLVGNMYGKCKNEEQVNVEFQKIVKAVEEKRNIRLEQVSKNGKRWKLQM